MKTYSRRKPIKDEFTFIHMDLNEICRLCLSGEGEKYPIFENEVLPLSIRIMACLSVQVYEGDGLPAQVCHQCIEELDNYSRFKKKCESSDHQLRQYIKNLSLSHEATQLTQGGGSTDTQQVDTSSLLCHTPDDQDEEDIMNDIRENLENNKQLEDEEDVAYEVTDENEATATAAMLTSAPKESQVKKERAKRSINVIPNFEVPTHQVNPDTGTLTEMTPVSIIPQPPANDGLPFMCSKCPKRFGKRIELRRHESVHDQQRGFECPICEKWFPNKTSFGRHERTHTGERPYACNQCGKSFSQGAILARHIMTHTGVKPFKCDICNKGFTQREGLRVHMRQHSKEQHSIHLHDCPLCDKSFCHPSGLSRHLIIHTGKTFDCTVCSKVFTDASSLRRHMKRHVDSVEQSLSQTQ